MLGMTSGTEKVSRSPRTTNLERLRHARSLSREELAAVAGLSPRTIYALEVEGVRPQRATRRVLAIALGCAVDELTPSTSNAAGQGGVARTSEDSARVRAA